MTGFGRAEMDAQIGQLTVEIQSLNRKYLEVYLTLPKEFSSFEHEVRKWVAGFVSRGQISLKVYLTLQPCAIMSFLPRAELLKELKRGWDQIAREVGVDSSGVDLAFMMQYLPSQQRETVITDEDFSSLKLCMKEAMDLFLAMKRVEGKTLALDFKKRLQDLEQMLSEIEEFAPDATAKYKQKLLEKMDEVLKSAPEFQERLLREIALFAEKVDISEEVTRFKSHVDQFRALLKGGAVGRKMDFLIQEMGREVNTIGSKSMEAKISHLVVSMKSELEKLREQVQNIE
jgi:uncharacterized protein (TIGR00255 family)